MELVRIDQILKDILGYSYKSVEMTVDLFPPGGVWIFGSRVCALWILPFQVFFESWATETEPRKEKEPSNLVEIWAEPEAKKLLNKSHVGDNVGQGVTVWMILETQGGWICFHRKFWPVVSG